MVIVTVLSAIPLMCCCLFPPYFDTPRGQARRMESEHRLKNIGLALRNAKAGEAFGQFPPAAGRREPVPVRHSWRVEILPLIERTDLYERYDFTQAWDSPHNLELLKEMPKEFESVFLQEEAAEGLTPIVALVPPGDELKPLGNFAKGRPAKDLPLVVHDLERLVPWTKPEDVAPEQIAARPTWEDARTQGLMTLFADGSVRTLEDGDREQLQVTKDTAP